MYAWVSVQKYYLESAFKKKKTKLWLKVTFLYGNLFKFQRNELKKFDINKNKNKKR